MPLANTTTHHRERKGLFRTKKDKSRIAAGYKAALVNPNTTRQGRKHAKYELEKMGRGREAHVPFMKKVMRMLGIRSTPKRRTL